MAKKRLTAAQWWALLDDDTYWAGLCMEEVALRVNGEEVEEVATSLPPETLVTVEGGTICDADTMCDVKSLTAFITTWLRQQGVRQVVIEVPADMTDKAVRERLKGTGLKVAIR